MGSKKGIPHRKWTREEKLELVKLHLNEHISILEIERRYGVTHQLISAWTKKYLDEGEQNVKTRFERIIKNNLTHLTDETDGDTIKAEYVSAADPTEKSADRKEKNAGKNDSETN